MILSPSKDLDKALANGARCPASDTCSFTMQHVYWKFQETAQPIENWRFQHKRIEHLDRFDS